MSTFVRYLLFQLPGWGVAVVGATLLGWWTALPGWAPPALVGAWVLKDLMIYPLLRKAYERSQREGIDRLIGVRGIARRELDPYGYVMIRGELWRAEAEPSQRPIAEGSSVIVSGTRGFTLIVARDENA